MDSVSPNLDTLRRRIDEIDDRIHDLILSRAALVEQIASRKKSDGQAALRPGREATILRRLVARHHGPFPRQALVQLWRELLGGMVAMQGRFVVAVTVPEEGVGCWDMARDHFGGHVPMLALGATREVLSAVAEGRATVGVLPVPSENDIDPWWPAMAGSDGNGPRVLARLPFDGNGNARGGNGGALVIGRGEPDPTGADRTMLVVEVEGEMSRTRLIAALENIGHRVAFLAAYEPIPGIVWNLIEIDELVLPNDPRLDSVLDHLGEQAKGVRFFGLYARPLPLEPR